MGFSKQPDKRSRLIWSMITLAIIILGVGFVINFITGYLRSQDPIYQCIKNPNSQPFKLAVPITVTRDKNIVSVPTMIGFSNQCIKPIHTLEKNLIHVAYNRQYPFTLGHFLYIWGIDISRYNAKVYVNGTLYTRGSYLDIPLKNGIPIRVDFTSKA
jgi:hypothetical protein